jgi:hypothetical protein
MKLIDKFLENIEGILVIIVLLIMLFIILLTDTGDGHWNELTQKELDQQWCEQNNGKFLQSYRGTSNCIFLPLTK